MDIKLQGLGVKRFHATLSNGSLSGLTLTTHGEATTYINGVKVGGGGWEGGSG